MVTPIPRDQYGRPLIIPPTGGKPVAYRRASSLGKTLEDTTNVEGWEKRLLAIGLAARPDLLAAAARCQVSDRQKLNGIIKEALDAAGRNNAANLGTARHELLEQSDLGQMIGFVLPGEQEVIDTWEALKAAHGLTCPPEYAEVFVVNHVLRSAGSADRLVHGPWGPKLRVLDFKFGGVDSPKYAGIGWSTQFAVYAGGELYTLRPEDVTDDGDKVRYAPDARPTYTPLDIDTEVGLVVHMPADGPAQMYEADLVFGLTCGHLANQVITARTEARKVALRKVGSPIASPSSVPAHPAGEPSVTGGSPATEPLTLGEASEVIEQQVMPAARAMVTDVTIRTQLAERIAAIRPNVHAFGDLAAWWPPGVKPWKLSDPPHYEGDELVLIDKCVADVEAKWCLPFVETFPPAPPVPVAIEPVVPEPEAKVSDETIAALRDAHTGLQPAMRQLADQWAVEARAAGHPVGLTTKRTERAAAITRAMVRWAEVVGAPEIGDEWVRAALSLVGRVIDDGITTGAYLGALTLVEANVVADIAETIGRDGLICGYTDDSTPVIHGTALEGLLAPLARAL